MTEVIHWSGTEDEQRRERMKACRSRRRTYGQKSCEDKEWLVFRVRRRYGDGAAHQAMTPAARLAAMMGAEFIERRIDVIETDIIARLMKRVTPGWAGAMVSAFGLRERGCSHVEDAMEAKKDTAVARDLAAALPSILAHITALAAEIERLRAALEPFGALANIGDSNQYHPDAGFTLMHHHKFVGCLTLANLRAARAALGVVLLPPDFNHEGE